MTETFALASIIVLVAMGIGIALLVTLVPLIDYWRENAKKKRARPT